MHQREVTALDRYWDTVHAILWPRFEHIVRLHMRSVLDCNVNNFASIDVRPHYVSNVIYRYFSPFSDGVIIGYTFVIAFFHEVVLYA